MSIPQLLQFLRGIKDVSFATADGCGARKTGLSAS